MTLADLRCRLHLQPEKGDSLSKYTSHVKRSCQTLRLEGTSIRRQKSKARALDVTCLLIWYRSPLMPLKPQQGGWGSYSSRFEKNTIWKYLTSISANGNVCLFVLSSCSQNAKKLTLIEFALLCGFHCVLSFPNIPFSFCSSVFFIRISLLCRQHPLLL